MKRFLVLVLLLGIAVIILTDWSKGNQLEINVPDRVADTAYSPKIVQNIEVTNYNITDYNSQIYTHKPRRVLAIGENITETLVALGEADSIAAAVSYGNAFYVPEPENAEAYRKINFAKWGIPNIETVLAINPDLIISGQSLFTDKGLRSTAFWHAREINTFLPLNANAPASRIHRESLENEYNFILGLGTIFAKEKEAENIVRNARATLAAIRKHTEGRGAPKVLIIERLGKNIVVYDKNKLVGDICSKLGGEVPISPVGTVGLEYLLDENPDVMLVVESEANPEKAADYFRKLPALQSMQCIQNKRVYGIALNYTYNTAIKTQKGIEKIAKILYPDLHIEM